MRDNTRLMWLGKLIQLKEQQQVSVTEIIPTVKKFSETK